MILDVHVRPKAVATLYRERDEYVLRFKGSDEKTPFLGFNEFYSLRVLERLNVVLVAKARMSIDGRLLIVDRLDVGPDGIPHAGLEDACSLLGLPPHEKYLPSLEAVTPGAPISGSRLPTTSLRPRHTPAMPPMPRWHDLAALRQGRTCARKVD